MARAPNLRMQRDGESWHASPNEEDRGLLSGNASDDEDIVVHPGAAEDGEVPKTPRSANRVRFSIPEVIFEHPIGAPPSYDDSVSSSDGIPLSGRRDQHASLLTGADTAEQDENAHDDALAHLNRPKSSLRSAMSNMANSIIGAGIIGQPYALRQAGLLTGVTLLILLTITVDWTIRLIVINSKLSGRDSFQGTVEHCFGKTGLIAISVAQWAFAYGGMVAFGVIVGDSIPHVLEAVFPGIGDVPVIGWFASRRGVILILILAISLPLSLYRDIAKVYLTHFTALCSIYANKS